MNRKKKVCLYTYSLGKTKKDCRPDTDLIHSAFWACKKDAKRTMKEAMEDHGHKKGSIIKCTFKVVK